MAAYFTVTMVMMFLFVTALYYLLGIVGDLFPTKTPVEDVESGRIEGEKEKDRVEEERAEDDGRGPSDGLRSLPNDGPQDQDIVSGLPDSFNRGSPETRRPSVWSNAPTLCEVEESSPSEDNPSEDNKKQDASAVVSCHPTSISTLSPSESDAHSDKLVRRLSAAVDPIIYSVIIILGLFLFYLVPERPALPLFLGINIGSYLFASRVVPPSYKRILHPILVTSLITVLLVWGFGASVGWGLKETLGRYSGGVRYLDVFEGAGGVGGGIGPGAGDVLSSVLDAGIVS